MWGFGGPIKPDRISPPDSAQRLEPYAFPSDASPRTAFEHRVGFDETPDPVSQGDRLLPGVSGLGLRFQRPSLKVSGM